MVNHIRTLLLNEMGLPGFPGEAFVFGNYRPRVLPRPLANIRARLFGSSPDRIMLNYRLQQFMGLLHATDAVSFVTAKDPRTTYDKVRDPVFFPAQFFTPLVVTHGAGPMIGSVYGEPIAPDATGETQSVYTFEGFDDFVFNLYDITHNKQIETDLPVDVEGKSAPLADTGYFVQFDRDYVEYCKGQITITRRPQWDVGAILAGLDLAGDGELSALFGASTEEPYRSFANLFQRNNENAYRLAGVLLALAWRTDAIKETRGG